VENKARISIVSGQGRTCLNRWRRHMPAFNGQKRQSGVSLVVRIKNDQRRKWAADWCFQKASHIYY